MIMRRAWTRRGRRPPDTGTARRAIFVAALVPLALATLTLSADAQLVCLPRTDLVKELERKFFEKPLAYGVTDSGTLLEIFSSRDGITWTLVVTGPNGRSCVMASGDSWTTLPASTGERDT